MTKSDPYQTKQIHNLTLEVSRVTSCSPSLATVSSTALTTHPQESHRILGHLVRSLRQSDPQLSDRNQDFQAFHANNQSRSFRLHINPSIVYTLNYWQDMKISKSFPNVDKCYLANSQHCNFLTTSFNVFNFNILSNNFPNNILDHETQLDRGSGPVPGALSDTLDPLHSNGKLLLLVGQFFRQFHQLTQPFLLLVSCLNFIHPTWQSRNYPQRSPWCQASPHSRQRQILKLKAGLVFVCLNATIITNRCNTEQVSSSL